MNEMPSPVAIAWTHQTESPRRLVDLLDKVELLFHQTAGVEVDTPRVPWVSIRFNKMDSEIRVHHEVLYVGYYVSERVKKVHECIHKTRASDAKLKRIVLLWVKPSFSATAAMCWELSMTCTYQSDDVEGSDAWLELVHSGMEDIVHDVLDVRVEGRFNIVGGGHALLLKISLQGVKGPYML